MSSPYPEQVLVCSMCGLDWSKHYQLAYWRMQIYEDDAMPTEDEVVQAIGFQECIHLLKEANRGPQGPPGPQGAMGPQGASG